MAVTLQRKTWVDDDGSGTTGTIINNARLQGDIYDPVDQALAQVPAAPASVTDEALVRFDGPTGKLLQSSPATLGDAGPLTLTTVRPTLVLTTPGVTAKARLTANAANVAQLTQNISYDGTNRNLDDITLPGIELAVYNGTVLVITAPAGANPRVGTQVFTILTDGSIRERARAVSLGEWAAVAFNAADFTTSNAGGTGWNLVAGNVTTLKYTLIGKTMTLAFVLVNTSIGGTAPTELRIKIPGGFSAASQVRSSCMILDPAVSPAIVGAQCFSQAGVAYIAIQKFSAGVFTSNAVNVNVYGEIAFEIA